MDYTEFREWIIAHYPLLHSHSEARSLWSAISGSKELEEIFPHLSDMNKEIIVGFIRSGVNSELVGHFYAILLEARERFPDNPPSFSMPGSEPHYKTPVKSSKGFETAKTAAYRNLRAHKRSQTILTGALAVETTRESLMTVDALDLLRCTHGEAVILEILSDIVAIMSEFTLMDISRSLDMYSENKIPLKWLLYMNRSAGANRPV